LLLALLLPFPFGLLVLVLLSPERRIGMLGKGMLEWRLAIAVSCCWVVVAVLLLLLRLRLLLLLLLLLPRLYSCSCC
jgi:hypothetical protein